MRLLCFSVLDLFVILAGLYVDISIEPGEL